MGLDGMRLLSTRDRSERLVLAAVTKKAIEVQKQLHEHLAIQIAEAVGKMLGG